MYVYFCRPNIYIYVSLWVFKSVFKLFDHVCRILSQCTCQATLHIVFSSFWRTISRNPFFWFGGKIHGLPHLPNHPWKSSLWLWLSTGESLVIQISWCVARICTAFGMTILPIPRPGGDENRGFQRQFSPGDFTAKRAGFHCPKIGI